MHLLNEAVRKHETRNSEKDRDHRGSRVDESEEWQLPVGAVEFAIVAAVDTRELNMSPVEYEDHN